LIEVRLLRYFLAVSDELHFGRAAQRLHMAQPPLSQAIRKLEAEIGVQLLQRTSRVVELTDAGRVFADRARMLLAGLEASVEETRRMGGLSLRLRIGFLPGLRTRLLLDFVSAFSERDPDVSPEVMHLSAEEQRRRLRSGDLDLGIFHETDVLPGLRTEPLAEGEPVAAWLRSDHQLALKQSLGPEDLSGQPLLKLPRVADPIRHDRGLALLEEAGYRFKEIRETGDTDARDVLFAAAIGRGVALLPSALGAEAAPDARLTRRALAPPVWTPEIVVAWLKNPPAHLRPSLTTAREVAQALRAAQPGHTDDQDARDIERT
jgi:DNA-binding transcriptional LysR family regulator